MQIENTSGRRWGDLSMLERFQVGWEQIGYEGSDMTTEYVFHPHRTWRLDVAFPSCKVGIEFDGMGFGHQAIARLRSNYQKQNAAVELGWRVLRFESKLMSMKRLPLVIEQVMRTLSGEADPTAHTIDAA